MTSPPPSGDPRPQPLPSALARVPTILATAVAIMVPLSVLVTPKLFGPLAATAIWGLAIVLCFAGWGSWLGRRLVAELEVDWGLRAAWGLALTIAVGGPLCLFGLARRPTLLIWIFGGIALATREMFRVSDSPPQIWRRFWTVVAGCRHTPLIVAMVSVVGFLYLGAAARAVPNPNDDWVAYLPFVRKILQTGTFVDPFSVRRMAAYGGQSYLQALTLIVAEVSRVQIFDGGICLVLSFALIFGFAREARRISWTILLLVGLVVIMLPDNRANSAAEMSGVVGFVAAWRTVVLIDRAGLRGARPALLTALSMAAVCTLRQNYLPVVGFMLLALCLRRGDEQQSPSWADRRRHLGLVVVLLGACLLPWASLAFRSNHTFLFPFFHGNYDPNYGGITAPSPWNARLRFYLSAAFYGDPIRTMPLLLLVGPGIAAVATGRAVWGLWAGTIVGFAVLALSLPDADTYTIARYDFAYVVAFVIALGLAVADQGTTSKRDLSILVLVVVGLAIQVYDKQAAGIRAVSVALDRLGSDSTPSVLETDAEDERRMQQAVPAGERLLVMIERPYLLDYARNPIEHLDYPGAASPAPGIPLLAGSEKVAAYLVARGTRYFAFATPDHPRDDLYSRAKWKTLLTGPTRMWRIAAPLFLAAFDTVDELARSRRRIYDDGHLIVIDLDVAAR